MLAVGAILVALGGLAVVIVLHILTGPTPVEVNFDILIKFSNS